MSIRNENLGMHEDVLTLRFGAGDIAITKGRVSETAPVNMILFNQQTPRKIGEINSDWEGMTTDELPKPAVVMVFDKPESITALIHQLIEVQKEVFDMPHTEEVNRY